MKENKTNEKLFNYILTLGFIFMLVVFLVLLVGISRFVLSDDNSLGAHVKSTKDLIENIDMVDNRTLKPDFDMINSNFLAINTNSANITDYSYYNNIEANISFLTFKFDSPILEKDNFLYVKIKDFDSLKKGNMIIFKDDLNELKIGHVLLVDENFLELMEQDSFNIIRINKETVEGELIFKKND